MGTTTKIGDDLSPSCEQETISGNTYEIVVDGLRGEARRAYQGADLCDQDDI